MTISTLPLRSTIRMASSARSIHTSNHGALLFASMRFTPTRHTRRTLATTTTTTAAAMIAPGADVTKSTQHWPALLNPLGRLLHRNNDHNQILNKQLLLLLRATGLALTLAVAQYSLGDAPDFFEYRFITNKKSEDLADFYGTEG
jgi:hypothetical protein